MVSSELTGHQEWESMTEVAPGLLLICIFRWRWTGNGNDYARDPVAAHPRSSHLPLSASRLGSPTQHMHLAGRFLCISSRCPSNQSGRLGHPKLTLQLRNMFE